MIAIPREGLKLEINYDDIEALGLNDCYPA